MKIFNNPKQKNDSDNVIYIGYKKKVPVPKKAIAVLGMGWQAWGLLIAIGVILVMSAPPTLIESIKHIVSGFIQ